MRKLVNLSSTALLLLACVTLGGYRTPGVNTADVPECCKQKEACCPAQPCCPKGEPGHASSCKLHT